MKKLFAATGLTAALLVLTVTGASAASAVESPTEIIEIGMIANASGIDLGGASEQEFNAAIEALVNATTGVTYKMTTKGNELHYNIDQVYNAYKNAPNSKLELLGITDIIQQYDTFKSIFGDVFVMVINYDDQKNTLDYFMKIDGELEHYHTLSLNEDNSTIQPPNYATPEKEDVESVLWVRDAPKFKDISDHFAERQIVGLYRMGVVNGVTDTTYAPNQNLTRAQFAAMLVNTIAEVELEVYNNPNFKDINGHWAKDAIVQLYKLGVINGSSPTAFEPNKPISRQQAVAMMERYLKAMGFDTDQYGKTLPFKDNNQISDYARSGAAILANMGVVSGDQNGYFKPADTLTRGQMAKILYGVIEEMIVQELSK